MAGAYLAQSIETGTQPPDAHRCRSRGSPPRPWRRPASSPSCRRIARC